MRRFISVLLVTIGGASFACGGDTTSTPDAGTDADNTADAASDVVVEVGPDVDNGAPSTTYPAFKIDPPQVVDVGGPTLATPNVIPIYFGNDDTSFTGQITTYLNKLKASTYWGPSIVEYDIGALSIATPIQLTESATTPTIDDAAIQTWLAGKLAGDPSFPAPDANSIYTIFYPTGTTVTLQGESSCVSGGFGGYHSSITYNSANVAYAVVPRCATFNDGLTGINATTGAASHEIIEASTDPYPSADTAYGQLDDDHVIWEFIAGGAEVGDLCVPMQGAFITPADIGFSVQRTWSNKAAKAGHDWCQPADTTPYFNSMPVLTDSIDVAGQITTKGVQIPIGKSATIEVDLFSDADTGGPWTVTAIDSATLQKQPTELTFVWDRTTGQNGEKLHLTITVVQASQYNAEAFILTSQLGTKETLWMGLVGN